LWLRKSLAGSSRLPEFKAHTLRPAWHRVLMAIPPPAPVPTTITSYTVSAMPMLLAMLRVCNSSRGLSRHSLVFRRWQVKMLRIIPVGTSGRFRVERESRVVQLLEPRARSVKARDRVFPDQLEELAAFCFARPELALVS